MFFDYVGFHFSYSPFFYVCVFFRMVLQETYEVLDTLYYDKAKSGTGNYNDNIWYHPYATLTRETDGTVITPTSTWGGAYIGDTTSAILIPKNTIVEFDLITFVSDFIIQMRSGVQQSGSWVYCEPTKVVGHQRWEISSNTQKIYVNDVLKQNMSQNLGDSFRLTFLSQYSGKSCKIANLKIYPI